MDRFFCVLLAVLSAVHAAPQNSRKLYYDDATAPQRLSSNALDYYFQQAANNYYSTSEHKQEGESDEFLPGTASGRLETLDPDSEVELLPGAQQPQQPPQQNPVSPNVPGLLPGQRVFIVQMPVAGYRPGTIGGYQPVYIVAAGAQGNANYPANGYQNPAVLEQGGQSPYFGFQRPELTAVNGAVGSPGLQGFNGYAIPASASDSGVNSPSAQGAGNSLGVASNQAAANGQNIPNVQVFSGQNIPNFQGFPGQNIPNFQGFSSQNVPIGQGFLNGQGLLGAQSFGGLQGAPGGYQQTGTPGLLLGGAPLANRAFEFPNQFPQFASQQRQQHAAQSPYSGVQIGSNPQNQQLNTARSASEPINIPKRPTQVNLDSSEGSDKKRNNSKPNTQARKP